jgi:hypothetical protein
VLKGLTELCAGARLTCVNDIWASIESCLEECLEAFVLLLGTESLDLNGR